MREALMRLVMLVVAALSPACGATSLPATPGAPSPAATTGPAMASPAAPSPEAGAGGAGPTATIPPAVEQAAQIAIADLGRRLGVAAAQIVVKSSQPVDWPDTSLGCPQKGMMYAQVITPGHKVVLTVGGKDYTYHTSKSQAVLCSPEG